MLLWVWGSCCIGSFIDEGDAESGVFFVCVGGQRRGLGLLEFLSLGMGRAFKGGMARCGGGNNHALLGGLLDLWCSCWALRIAEGAKEL